MPSFPKPSFTFDYDADAERAALRHWRDSQPGRAIPAKDPNRLLLATWNIANLGAQDRGPKDYALLAEVISWFDLVAVQEVKNNRVGLNGLMAALPATWRTLSARRRTYSPTSCALGSGRRRARRVPPSASASSDRRTGGTWSRSVR